jgi:hyaluronan synthase
VIKLSFFQQPSNKGKSIHLYRVSLIGIGEIFVTIDSDSIIKTDILRNLVSPLLLMKFMVPLLGMYVQQKNAILPKTLNVSLVMSSNL